MQAAGKSEIVSSVLPIDADEQTAVARKRLEALFKFLRELHLVRSPVVSELSRQEWRLWMRDLPQEKSVVRPATEDDDFVLKVRRARVSSAPRPADEVQAWLATGWDDPEQEIVLRKELLDLDGSTGEERRLVLQEIPKLASQADAWKARWVSWADREKPARRAAELFEKLYELYGRLDRDGDELELVLGDGLLHSNSTGQVIDHPVLLVRVNLEFDPAGPEFIIRESGRSVELYSALLHLLKDLNAEGLENSKAELEEGGFHPRGGSETAGFLRRLVQGVLPRDGHFFESRDDARNHDGPTLHRDAVLFLRKKSLGYAEMVDAILRSLHTREILPTGLERIVGTERAKCEDGTPGGGSGPRSDIEILLSKPANQEQVLIAEQLERHRCVLVQGPPGTGKSHTIGNLIGHLLAQGTRVLVTAHTTKALRVLHDHVVSDLRSLCVGVLEGDLTARQQLEESVNEIIRRVSGGDAVAEQLEGQARVRSAERLDLLEKLSRTRNDLRGARNDEYRDVVVGGTGIAPAAASRAIRMARSSFEWLSPGLHPAAALPLAEEEVGELYNSNGTITEHDESELASGLPPMELLPDADWLRAACEDVLRLKGADTHFGEGYWRHNSPVDPEPLGDLADRLAKAVSAVKAMPRWQLMAVQAGQQGPPTTAPWESLLGQIEDLVKHKHAVTEVILQHGPELSPTLPLEAQVGVGEEIAAHVEAGKGLGFFAMIGKAPWKALLAGATVNGRSPAKKEEFRSISAKANLEVRRRALVGRWDRQLGSLGAPLAATFGREPEETFRQYGDFIREALVWKERVLDPIFLELDVAGLNWKDSFGRQDPVAGELGTLLRVTSAADALAVPALRARAAKLRLARAETVLNRLAERLATWGQSHVGEALAKAASRRDPDLYGEAYARRRDLERKKAIQSRRSELLDRLGTAAPLWAADIRCRIGAHGKSEPPGDPVNSWRLRQWQEELDRRASKDLNDLQSTVNALQDRLLKVTSELVERKAWAAQARKTNLARRQALVGWQQVVRRLGKGTGKRAPELRREAQRLMEQAVSAVPVWIMPLSRVTENFDPERARFDVVIVDEASQADVMALAALYLGDQIVVVGDDEQVSPEAVGQDLTKVKALISQYLRDVPNSTIFDGKMSVYDLAKASFGGVLTLREHFRCVPEIIQFSNQLSYPGANSLIPLRDSSRVPRRPFVVPYRVEGATSRNKVNQIEAEAIASLVVSAIQEPEYALNEKGKPVSFGVISMVGEEQAREIEKLLRSRLSPTEFQRRRILCGNPAQFQGDERDVVFLSLVDGPGDGTPLTFRQDDRFKKRFNVAASRGRDQLWVVFSMNPKTDLRAGDLRLQLIEHAFDPESAVRRLRQGEGRVQSEFERLVLKDLAGRGYRVQAQFQVGTYSIDLVVECAGKRMAIECDGDRYHTLENLGQDMIRQSLLERLGWRFIRIRGSAFFRDPDGVMAAVARELEAVEIFPEAEPTSEGGERGRDLLERVVRKAQDIRREWNSAEDDSAPEAETPTEVFPPPLIPLSGPEEVAAGFPPAGTRQTSLHVLSTVSDYDKVLELIRKRKTIVNRDVQELLGVDGAGARVQLARLVREGIAVLHGTKRGSRYQLLETGRAVGMK